MPALFNDWFTSLYVTLNLGLDEAVEVRKFFWTLDKAMAQYVVTQNDILICGTLKQANTISVVTRFIVVGGNALSIKTVLIRRCRN